MVEAGRTLSLIIAAGAVVLGLIAPGPSANAQSGAPRVAFQISTGSTSGGYFPVGELLAQTLSHPPGIGRCESGNGNICAPPGVIMSTRASEGSVANVNAVRQGNASSGFVQADVVAQAVAGLGPFRKAGPDRQIRVIANIYGEDVYLLAGKDSKIRSVADLRGKRVAMSTEGSGTIVTARAILSAYRLTEKSITPNYDSSDKAADLLQEGKIDAMFYVGGTPAGLVAQMLDEGVAKLVPIDGVGRKRLLDKEPYLTARTLPQGAYSGSAPVDTVSVDSLWITDASQPDDLIYGIMRALYNPANRATLESGRVGSHFLDLDSATKNLTAPLHPGAERYFTEVGALKPAVKTPAAAPAPSGQISAPVRQS